MRIVRLKRETETVLHCFPTVVPIQCSSIMNVESEGWAHAGLGECDWIESKDRFKE